MEEFKNWIALNRVSLAHFRDYGECAVVYAMRDGETRELLKFGKTGRARDRIFKNYIGGVGGSTTKRIHAELFANAMISRVEIAWIDTNNGGEAEAKETQFRREFVKANGRRPKWDLKD